VPWILCRNRATGSGDTLYRVGL